jgi:hypothetical protein
LSDREGIAVRIPEVGDLGATLERGDAPLVRDDRPFVVALEGDAPGVSYFFSSRVERQAETTNKKEQES